MVGDLLLTGQPAHGKEQGKEQADP